MEQEKTWCRESFDEGNMYVIRELPNMHQWFVTTQYNRNGRFVKRFYFDFNTNKTSLMEIVKGGKE